MEETLVAKYALVDTSYCFLAKHKAILSVDNILKMANSLSPEPIEPREVLLMAQIAPKVLDVHQIQLKQAHKDEVFLPVQKAKEEVEVITLTTIPHLSERGKAKRKKLFEESIKNYVWPTDSFTNPNTAVAAMTHEPVEEPEGHKPEWNTSNTCIEKMMPCAKWIQMLKGLDIYRNQIVHIEHIPSKPGKYRSVSDLKLPSRLVQALDTFGIKELYHHQYEAIQAALKGHNVVISTSTSSGKSLAYNIPVMHSLLENSNTNVFYLFPTKALAQDQLKSLRRFFSQAGGFPPNICSTFDGDTPMKIRTSIIRHAQLFLTNPDMLHLTILPQHKRWRNVLSNLKYLIVDEAHMYRGIFGSHVSGVFRRLFRLCALYGSNPQVICCSATIRNPEQHFRLLIPSLPSPAKSEGHGTDAKKDQLPANLDFFRNRSLEIVTKDGSPSGAKSICVWNVAVGTRDTVTKPLPFTSESKKTKKRKRSVRANEEQLPPTKDPSDEPTSRVSMSAIYQSSKILAQLVQDEVATLLFCKSRKLTELVLMNTHTILKENRVTAKYVNKVHSYRGGYTAYDRRNIERKFFQGELLGVVATNALELGIDVGGLDCTIHLGLPTSVASLWQQAGRAGRGGKDSLAVIVCFDSPLDQYFARNCEELFQLKPEAVALNPNNATVAKYHLQCAANESPLLSKTTGTLYIDHFIFKDIFSTGSLMLDTLGGFMSASAPPIMSELMSEQKLVLCKDTKGFPGDGGFRLHACVSPIFRQTSIRSIATTVYTVVTDDDENLVLDSIPGDIAFFQVYPTAVYLHQSQEYIITKVDVENTLVFAKKCTKKLTYFTTCRDYTDVDVCKIMKQYDCVNSTSVIPSDQQKGHVTMSLGIVSVKTSVFGCLMHEKRTMAIIHRTDFSLPPMQHFGHAVWLEIPYYIQDRVERATFGWKGSLHGVGHLLLTVIPLFLLCDTGDINTEHYNPFEERRRPNRVTIYEGREGGSGIVEEIAKIMHLVIEKAYKLAKECDCLAGCPSCLHYARCSEYNEVLDKRGALLILESLVEASHQGCFKDSRC